MAEAAANIARMDTFGALGSMAALYERARKLGVKAVMSA